jgi:act minimal PKS chain-length factor (CLF/KS beta)
MIAGAVQETSEELMLAFLQVSGQTASRTLAANPTGGVVIGEGCSLLTLERPNASVLPRALWLGYGQAFSPGVRDAGDPAAACEAIRLALQAAGLGPEDIGAVFASASGDPLLDSAEAAALGKIFGASTPPATALKSFWGETYYASGAMAVAAAILCLEQGFLPPTLNLAPGAEARGFSSQPRQVRARVALVLALDRDQKAAALILEIPRKD